MPDVTLTMGMDTPDVTAGVNRAAAEVKRLRSEVENSIRPARHATDGLAGSMKHMGHEVTGSARAFHHLAFAPIMIAGIAYEFYHLGTEINEFVHGALEDGGDKARDFITSLDFAKPAESLTKLREELEHLNAKMTTGGSMRDQAQTLLGGIFRGDWMYSGAQAARDEEQKTRLLKQQEALEKSVTTLSNRKFERLDEELDLQQQGLDIQKKRLDGDERGAAIDQARLSTARELSRIRHDETLSADQRARALDRLGDMRDEAADLAGREFDRRRSGHGKSATLGVGVFSGALAQRVFGDSTAPTIATKLTAMQKLFERTVQLLEEDSKRSGGGGVIQWQ